MDIDTIASGFAALAGRQAHFTQLAHVEDGAPFQVWRVECEEVRTRTGRII